MPRPCLLLLFATLSFPGSLHAQAQAASGWDALAHLKTGRRGTIILVEPVYTPEHPIIDERCRLQAITTDTLTCTQDHAPAQRFVFSRDQVEAVYRVGFSPKIGHVILGTLIGLLCGIVSSFDDPKGGLVLLEALAGAGVGASIRDQEKTSPVYLRQPGPSPSLPAQLP